MWLIKNWIGTINVLFQKSYHFYPLQNTPLPLYIAACEYSVMQSSVAAHLLTASKELRLSAQMCFMEMASAEVS